MSFNRDWCLGWGWGIPSLMVCSDYASTQLLLKPDSFNNNFYNCYHRLQPSVPTGMEHQFAPTDPYCPILLPNIYPSIKLSIQYMLQEVLLQREGQGLCETSKAANIT